MIEHKWDNWTQPDLNCSVLTGRDKNIVMRVKLDPSDSRSVPSESVLSGGPRNSICATTTVPATTRETGTRCRTHWPVARTRLELLVFALRLRQL